MKHVLTTYVRRDNYTGPKITRWISTLPYGSTIRRYLKLNLASGSREHYYHFLIGYLLPLILAQEKHRNPQFQVLDCGPLLNPILQETLERLGFEITLILPNQVRRPVYVEPWDQGWKLPKDIEAVEHTVNRIKEAWKAYTCLNCDCVPTDNLILRRSEPHAFYMEGGAEKSGYGTSRRGITNLAELSNFLIKNGVQFTIYEPGVHCLGCQINMFSKSKKFLGFRGAEWANLIWAPQEAHVRMLDNAPPATTIGRFMNRLQIKHEFALVPHSHSPESLDEALRFFTS